MEHRFVCQGHRLFSVFSASGESERSRQKSTTGSSLCSVFISRESGTSKSYCAYFKALLGEQADEVHFTVRLRSHAEDTQLQAEGQKLKCHGAKSQYLISDSVTKNWKDVDWNLSRIRNQWLVFYVQVILLFCYCDISFWYICFVCHFPDSPVGRKCLDSSAATMLPRVWRSWLNNVNSQQTENGRAEVELKLALQQLAC